MTYAIATCVTMLMGIVIAADIILMLIWLEAVSIAMAIIISN